MLPKSAYHHRARKAIAVRNGDPESAAQADLGLRAHRIAKTITVNTSPDLPPLPAETIDALRNLLPPVDVAVQEL